MMKALMVALLMLLGGCAEVQPWEKEQLAQPTMQDDNALRTRFRHHIYLSKEGSKGGTGVAGGGCGCN